MLESLFQKDYLPPINNSFSVNIRNFAHICFWLITGIKCNLAKLRSYITPPS